MSVHWGGRGPGHTSRLAKAAAASFDPLSLTPAAWYDPSDLSTLFQDTAGTTPVTADGQSVARINDKSGNGLHLTQATAANCPLYKTSGGLSWLQFDGSNDRIINVAAIAGSTHAIGIAALVTVDGPLWATTVGSTDRVTVFGAKSTGTVSANTSDGTTTTTKSGAGIDTAQVLLAEINQTAPTSAIRQNAVALSGTAGGTAGSANVATSLAANTAGSAVCGCRVYGVVHVAAAISAGQRASLETYLGSKCGLTL